MLLKNINTLNEYISASRDVLGESKNAKVQFNMSTVLALKKIRSYEIEYFNKYEENGIACAALQCMVDLGPSKTWGILGKEIVNLIQYWLDAIRKHLVSHSPHWYTFLRLLLNFIKEIRHKDSSLPNLLVEHTAECLLDLATNDRADAFKKYEILQCLNMYCAEANREIRFALRNKFGEYFVKLATYISSCGHFPCQLSVMETLLRWLVPRHDQILRSSSAEKWFPSSLYPADAVDVFLKRSWMDFFQDARDFLNIHNKASDLIVSVICRSLSIGKILIIPGKDKHVSWLDINSTGKCLSIVLEPLTLEKFGVTNPKSWETLIISEDNTQAAKLDKESHQLTLSVSTVRPPQAHPSLIKITNDTSKDVKIVVSAKTDLNQLDKALCGVFGNKYQLLLNLESEVTESSSHDTRNNTTNNSEDESRFSHPVVVRRGRHSGYIVRSRNPWKSPSTTSTTSLAQLHDKLAALPTYKFDKESESVCARPELSSIIEVSETDDRYSLQSATTLKLFRPYGVCYRGTKKAQNATDSPQRDESNKLKRGLSPAIGRKTAPSCLLVATIGSTDDSVISNTMERLAKNKDFEPDNIVDLLVKEALEANNENPVDSGINTGENSKTRQEDNCEAIANTPCADNFVNVSRKRGCTVIRESISDESNTEVISGTPFNYLNAKRNNVRKNEGRLQEVKSNVYDAEAVEEFFNLHFAQNFVGDTVISPTLAKKINESSSETSEIFDERVEVNENPQFDKSEVLECLNCIVDKVCEDFDKYTDYLNIDKEICNFISDIQEPLETTMEIQENLQKDCSLTWQKSDPEPTKSFKLKYKTSQKTEKGSKKTTITKKRKDNVKKYESAVLDEVIVQPKEDELFISAKTINKRKKRKINKKLKQNIKSTAEITVLDGIINEGNIEKENVPQFNIEEDLTATKLDLINDVVPDKDTSLIRRKRKLYSPKNGIINNERSYDNLESGDDITELKSSKVATPKSSTNFYKEIENERKKYTRKSKFRKSKIPETESPKTLKMNQAFDKLKETVESNEKITLVDKTFEIDVYNFTSDSEDEYFKKKKILTHKRPSITTIGSFESAMSTKHGRVTRKVNYTENRSSNDETSKQVSKRKRVVRKRKSTQRKVSVEPVIDLEDERMRQAPPDILNTSIIIDNPKETTTAEIEPILSTFPVLESIVDVEQGSKETYEKNKSVKKHKKIQLSLKKGNTSLKTNSIDIALRDDRTESPLPGLFVESATDCVDENNDSVTATMFQKFKKIYQDGFDACVNETNTTQNLLSDIDRVNDSPENTRAPEMIEDIQTDNCFEREVHVKKQVERTKKLKREIRTKNSHLNVSLIDSQNMDDFIGAPETKENNSEISITTEGINAHGDIDEAPPSPAMIEQQIQPRNLEFEDLEQSMKDFFDNLRNQITGNGNRIYENLDSSCENVYKQENGHKTNAKGKYNSAKVVVARLSAEEIDKWVSSDKSDSVKTIQKIQKQPKHKASIHEREKSPIVSVSRLSSGEIQKWLPSCNNSVSDQDNIKVQNKCQEIKGIQSLYESHRWFPSRKNSSSDIELEESNQNKTMQSTMKLIFKCNEPLPNMSVSSSNDITPRSRRSKNEGLSQKYNSKTKLKLLFHNISNLKNSQNQIDTNNNNDDGTAIKYKTLDESINRVHVDKSDSQKRSSVISPIKIGNFISQINKSNTPSDDDEYVKRMRNIFSENERNMSNKKSQIKSKSSQNYLDVLSSPDSTSTKINSSVGTKRKSMSIDAETKNQKMKVIHSAAVSESGPSISSVNEWFRKNEPNCSRDEMAQLSVIDCIQNVLEKLDTTLVNINGNTSKQFINLFVDAQKQLDEQRERHRAMYKQAASNMLTQIVKIMDETFCDLDKRSQEMDNSFMEQLRNRASQMILEDSKQKQAMVQIMKEDVQTVQDYIKNKL